MDFETVIAFFGTQQKTADALGLAQPTVASWKENGIPVPRQYQIQVVSKGKLKVAEKDRAA